MARNPRDIDSAMEAFNECSYAAENETRAEGAPTYAALAQAWATVILAHQVGTLREALVMGDDLALIAKELATIAAGRKA